MATRRRSGRGRGGENRPVVTAFTPPVDPPPIPGGTGLTYNDGTTPMFLNDGTTRVTYNSGTGTP